MPIKSAKQFRLMEAAAHSKSGKFGPSKEAAKEMLSKTSHKSKSDFAKRRTK